MASTASAHSRLHSADWQAWRDPDVPEYLNPTTLLLDKHLTTPIAHKTALLVDGHPYSYANLTGHVSRAGGALARLGLEAENRLLLFGSDSLEYLAVWLGAVRIGVVPAVISDLYKAPNLLYFLRDTAAKALFIDEEQLGKLAEIAADLPATLQVVIVRPAATSAAPGPPPGLRARCLSYDQAVAGSEPHPPVLRHRHDICYMFYSGGTTGTAKGIIHVPHDFVLIPERHGAFWAYKPADVVHATSKKYFTHGLWPGVLIPLYWGATATITRGAPTAENVLQVLQRDRPTKLITVPTVVKNLLLWSEQTGQQPDAASLEMVVTASEKIPPEIFPKFRAVFGVELFDSIGSSEVTYEWIANRPQEYRRGALGKPVFGFEVKLMDPDGDEITEPHQDGEAWVKSETACLFYWRKLEQTKRTFVGPWTRTGDTLQFDEDGFLWFSGRSDDVFKVKGLWVSPIEVEAAITEHPAVLEAAVIAIDDADGLTKPKAFVVLKPGHTPTADLTAAIRENVRKIGGYKVPESVVYMPALPRTTLMKIDRRALREMERQQPGRS